jgi:hypothetical protein
MQSDFAETNNIQKLISRIGAGLDQYLRFEHPDALHPGANWQDFLDVPLPQQGVGIDQVVEDLLKQVIPNGSPIPKPGFTSFITTGATSASVVASTAASIASALWDNVIQSSGGGVPALVGIHVSDRTHAGCLQQWGFRGQFACIGSSQAACF